MFRCFSSYKAWLALGGAAIVGGYLALWHGQHVAAALPFLVLLACPLMHIFMHGTHHDSHAGGNGGSPARHQLPPRSKEGG